MRVWFIDYVFVYSDKIKNNLQPKGAELHNLQVLTRVSFVILNVIHVSLSLVGTCKLF